MWDRLFDNLIVILPTLGAGSIVLVLLTILALSGMLRQLRSPASSVTWLITILLVPLIGIPLFWMFGERKFRKIAATKHPLGPMFGGHDAVASLAPGQAPTDLHKLGNHSASGNRMHFHANGEEAFADLMRLIDGARQSIEIQTYVMKADHVGRQIFERLTAKAAAGVEVRLLVDGLGALSLSRSAIDTLRRAGGKVQFFLPVWRFALLRRGNLRNHRKIAIVDSTKVFTGGRNLAAEYLGPTPMRDRWHDLSFVLEGPGVAGYIEIFRSDWQFASGEAVPPSPIPEPVVTGAYEAVMTVVPSGPDVVDETVYMLMLSMAMEARERLWIVTPYFVPNETLGAALRAAARRGVDVRVVVPAKGDQRIPDWARGPYLRDLSSAGGQVLLYTPTMLHSKAILLDNRMAAIGSANFDQRSMFLNFEVTSLIKSWHEIRVIETSMLAVMQQCRPGGEPVGKVRDTFEGVIRLLAPLL